ncbi:hypothetical protein WH50_02885 [Pokkaliibacter plantistimulans]|uniref:Phosphotransferase system EIIC domain-containing protein n=1 Tax=Pokkaliibacter plantistimulans TaxID=1635171 RepID=A0ABX5M540_9GAMM|nr:hypothetical protein WH50_02885 [Pokkaliibacter plantistimulans]
MPYSKPDRRAKNLLSGEAVFGAAVAAVGVLINTLQVRILNSGLISIQPGAILKLLMDLPIITAIAVTFTTSFT